MPLGDNAKLYIDVTGAEVTAWTELTVIIDHTLSSERVTAESNCRGDAEKGVSVGKPMHALSGTMLFKKSTAGTTYRACRDAYNANTSVGIASMSEDIVTVGSEGWFLDMKFSKFEISYPDGDNISVSFDLVKDADSTYASNYNTTV